MSEFWTSLLSGSPGKYFLGMPPAFYAVILKVDHANLLITGNERMCDHWQTTLCVRGLI